jgi:hypothetical protein
MERAEDTVDDAERIPDGRKVTRLPSDSGLRPLPLETSDLLEPNSQPQEEFARRFRQHRHAFSIFPISLSVEPPH